MINLTASRNSKLKTGTKLTEQARLIVQTLESGTVSLSQLTRIEKILGKQLAVKLAAPKVAFIIGSDSDLNKVKPAVEFLRKAGVDCELQVQSPVRALNDFNSYVKKLDARGFDFIIGACGGIGAVATDATKVSLLPVIGIPLTIELDPAGRIGVDSMTQAAEGLPIAVVGPNKAMNAALLAIRFLAKKHPNLKSVLKQYKKAQVAKVRKQNAALN